MSDDDRKPFDADEWDWQPADGEADRRQRANHGATIERLAAMDPINYDQVREAEAKELGCRATTLDRIITRARGEATVEIGQGRPLKLPRPDPWPDPVEGAALLADLAAFFARHAILPERGAVLLALWAVHTHCYDLWRYTPRLHVFAPTRRAGKTVVLRLLRLVVCKPLSAENITASAVFRAVAAVHPTLLIDEADQSLRDDRGNNNGDLVSILNGGHERGGQAVRTVGDDHEPRAFDTFAPVAIAGIGRLQGPLEDRCVQLPMRRAKPSERPAKIDRVVEAEGRRLARQIARWVTDQEPQLGAACPDMGNLYNRAEDNWTALYAIAEVAGDNWSDLARAAMAALERNDDDDAASLGEKLLADVRAVFDQPELTSQELVDRLKAQEGRPWADLGRSVDGLTTNRLARMLKPFGVVPTKVGPDAARLRGYRLTAFAEAFERHLGPISG